MAPKCNKTECNRTGHISQDKEAVKGRMRTVFEQAYVDYNTFKTEVLDNVFTKYSHEELSEDFTQNDDYKRFFANQPIEHFYAKGKYNIENRQVLNIYEVVISDSVKIHRARVGLQSLLRQATFMRTGQSALMVFRYANPAGRSWRLSYVAKTGDIEGKVHYTSAKRYTYIFGPNCHVRTAVERFAGIAGEKIQLDDLTAAFSVETVTKEFYTKLYNWYEWALRSEFNVTFPNDTNTADDDREENTLRQHMIRLITRIVFVWFIKQKNLIADELFDVDVLTKILNSFNPDAGLDGKGCKPQKEETTNYYHAILQNLFFATLNKDMAERGFAYDGQDTEKRIDAYGIKSYYRYEDDFTPEGKQIILNLFEQTPFLNGGLFECLDKPDRDSPNPNRVIYQDGFSRNSEMNGKNFKCRAFIPNCLFFHEDDNCPGLFPLLKHYNFTIEENSPNDTQVALDPELLGKIFENLLASYNPETSESAKKSTGSFYTPRGIVSYMVNQCIAQHLKTHTKATHEQIDSLVYAEVFKRESMCMAMRQSIQNELLKMRVLDPACGSGAFPIGMMQGLINILRKLDPTTEEHLYNIKRRILENCLFGVDIQPIAIQIAKLRCFISLIVEETPDASRPNLGLPTLPNLEHKFVIADSLRHANKKKDCSLYSLLQTTEGLDSLKSQLIDIRHQYFLANTYQKKKELCEREKCSINHFAEQLERSKSIIDEEIRTLIAWNPFDLNTAASFFDAEWMFDISGGFDVVIGNPPYVSNKGSSTEYKNILKSEYGFADDLYMHFFFRAYQELKPSGVLSLITSNTYWTIQTKAALRDLLLKQTSILNIDNTGYKAFKAMVGTSIMTTVKTVPESGNPITFIDRSQKWDEPEVLHCKQDLYLEAHNHVIFCPNELNLKLFNKFNAKVKTLYDEWWDKIKSSKDIAKNARALEKYRSSLKPGDITLIGLVTDGGQGLATANNGKYIAVMDCTKFADNIRKTRPEKLDKVIKKFKLNIYDKTKFNSTKNYLDSLSELEIVRLFDKLKEKYGRDVFGQGYLFRIINESELADVNELTEDEKANGIKPPKNTYVPYDKGDKDGNRWYVRTPYAIDWSRDNVHFLKTDRKARYQGYQFYFKEGFCWSDVHTDYIKARIKEITIHDVKSMSLFSNCNCLSSEFFVAWLNNDIINNYINAFITNTSTLQINDVRILPIIFTDTRTNTEIKATVSDLVDHKADPKLTIESEARIQQLVSDIVS